MYTSSYSTTLRNEPFNDDQRQGQLYIKRTENDQNVQTTKTCPSCGRDLVLLLEKFGEISEPRGPGPPAYPARNQPYHSHRPYYDQTDESPHYNNYQSSQPQTNNYYSQSGYQQSSPSNYYHHQDDAYSTHYDANVTSQKHSENYHTSHSRSNYYNQNSGYHQQDLYSQWDKSRDYDYGYTDIRDGSSNPQDILSGGWYCSFCGLHILPNDRIMDATLKQDEPPPVEMEQNSPDGKDANKSIDEEYKMWEIQVNKDFSNFLQHIKDYFSEKETKLKEYQIDLCQREKSLQSNESYFKERIDTLKKAEDEFQDKVERLNLQVQDRMQRLREYEARITRMSKSQKQKYKDMSTQTLPMGSYKDIYHSRGYHQINRNNFGYVQMSKDRNPPTQQSRDRLSRDPRSQDLNKQNYGPSPANLENRLAGGDSDYMFMGEVSKGSSPKDIAGSPYYVDIQHVASNGPPEQQVKAPEKQDMDNIMYVDTSNGNNPGDSGFNTPDADFNQTNQYSYEMEAPVQQKTFHATRPRDIKLGKVNSSNNSNNIPLESQSINSSSSRNSNTSLNYNGERAVLVKSPNGVESYTTRAQKFKNLAVHRSSSLPQNRGADRSPSPDRDRAQSMPPDPDTAIKVDTNLPERPKSAYFLDEVNSNEQLSPDSQRPRAGSFGSTTDQGHTSRMVTSPGPKPMTPTKSRLPRDRKPKYPDNNTNAGEKDTSTDSNKSNRDNITKIGLRSRSSESVQRGGYRYQKQLKYNEAKKKAQSELNLSSENWAEENQNDGVVIYHRKSTSFDSPQSYGFTHHAYQSKTVHSTTDPTVTETQKIEVSRSDGFVPSNVHKYEVKQIPTYQTEVSQRKPEVPTSDKPRVRGRRSDMSMPHRKINKMSYYTASGSHLNSQPSSYGIAIRAVPNSEQLPTNPVQSEITDSQTRTAAMQSNSLSPKFQYPSNGSNGSGDSHQYINQEQNSGERPENQQEIPYKDVKTGLHIDVSNEGGSESPEMTSTPRDYVPQSGSQDPVYPHPKHTANMKHSTLTAQQHYTNQTHNRERSAYPMRYGQSGQKTSINGQLIHVNGQPTSVNGQPTSVNGHANNVNIQPTSLNSHSSTVNTLPTNTNSKLQLSDQSSWALRRRRELPKMSAHDSNNNYGQRQLRHLNNNQPNPKYADHDYVNMYQTNHSNLNTSDSAVNQRSKSNNRETKLRRRTDHYVQRSSRVDQRIDKGNDADPRNGQFDQVIGNDQIYDQRNDIDSRYEQSDLRYGSRNGQLDTRDNVTAHRGVPTDRLKSSKTISYIPSDGLSTDVRTDSPQMDLYNNDRQQGVNNNNTENEEVFVPSNIENNNPAPQGKKKYFGFSPKYKELLFKHGSSSKNGEKASSKKKENGNQSPITITSNTTRFGFKKSAEKDSKSKKDKSRPTSPRTKLPHYNTYIKEITTK